MKRILIALLMIILLASATTPLLSHHSMASYDQTTIVVIRGVITRIQWMNPHSRITLTATNAGGTTTFQQIDIAGPSALAARSVDTRTFTIGATITLETWMAKDPGLSTPAYGRTLILGDGRRFDLGADFGDVFNRIAR